MAAAATAAATAPAPTPDQVIKANYNEILSYFSEEGKAPGMDFMKSFSPAPTPGTPPPVYDGVGMRGTLRNIMETYNTDVKSEVNTLMREYSSTKTIQEIIYLTDTPEKYFAATMFRNIYYYAIEPSPDTREIDYPTTTFLAPSSTGAPTYSTFDINGNDVTRVTRPTYIGTGGVIDVPINKILPSIHKRALAYILFMVDVLHDLGESNYFKMSPAEALYFLFIGMMQHLSNTPEIKPYIYYVSLFWYFIHVYKISEHSRSSSNYTEYLHMLHNVCYNIIRKISGSGFITAPISSLNVGLGPSGIFEPVLNIVDEYEALQESPFYPHLLLMGKRIEYKSLIQVMVNEDSTTNIGFIPRLIPIENIATMIDAASNSMKSLTVMTQHDIETRLGGFPKAYEAKYLMYTGLTSMSCMLIPNYNIKYHLSKGDDPIGNIQYLKKQRVEGHLFVSRLIKIIHYIISAVAQGGVEDEKKYLDHLYEVAALNKVGSKTPSLFIKKYFGIGYQRFPKEPYIFIPSYEDFIVYTKVGTRNGSFKVVDGHYTLDTNHIKRLIYELKGSVLRAETEAGRATARAIAAAKEAVATRATGVIKVNYEGRDVGFEMIDSLNIGLTGASGMSTYAMTQLPTSRAKYPQINTYYLNLALNDIDELERDYNDLEDENNKRIYLTTITANGGTYVYKDPPSISNVANDIVGDELFIKARDAKKTPTADDKISNALITDPHNFILKALRKTGGDALQCVLNAIISRIEWNTPINPYLFTQDVMCALIGLLLDARVVLRVEKGHTISMNHIYMNNTLFSVYHSMYNQITTPAVTPVEEWQNVLNDKANRNQIESWIEKKELSYFRIDDYLQTTVVNTILDDLRSLCLMIVCYNTVINASKEGNTELYNEYLGIAGRVIAAKHPTTHVSCSDPAACLKLMFDFILSNPLIRAAFYSRERSKALIYDMPHAGGNNETWYQSGNPAPSLGRKRRKSLRKTKRKKNKIQLRSSRTKHKNIRIKKRRLLTLKKKRGREYKTLKNKKL